MIHKGIMDISTDNTNRLRGNIKNMLIKKQRTTGTRSKLVT